MKNKEIEEILNYMKQYVENKYEHDSEPMLNYKDLQIVLSYIEQLEKKYNRSLDKLRNLRVENEQLENNRDKAIEYNKNILKENWYGGCEKENAQKNIDILKGDSDE